MSTPNSAGARPNFFLLLDIDPKAPWNQAHFNEVLSRKRIEWSRQSQSVGKRALDAKSNLQLIREIQRIMETRELRDEEAKAALAQEASSDQVRLQVRLQECEKRIEYLNAKTSIEQAEFDKFVAEFQDVLSSQEIRTRLIVKILPTRSSAPEVEQVQSLEPSIMKKITQLLISINMSTLYILLGYPETAATAELCRAAEQLNLDMVHRQQKTAEVEAKLQLAGLAKDIFRSNEMRKRYDYSMRLALLDVLLQDLNAIVDLSPKKELQDGQVRLFLERAQQVGWSEQEAMAQLKEHAHRRRWSIVAIPIDPNTQRVLCGSCHTLNEKQDKHCRSCSKPLYTNCPDCNTLVRSVDISCGNCGFPVGNRLWIEDDLVYCHTLLQAHNVKEAQKYLAKIEFAWQPKKPDGLSQKIEACNAEVQRIRQLLAKKVKQAEQLMDQRLFFQARQFVRDNASDIPNHETLQQIIDASIGKAQAELLLARKGGISSDEKREHCIQSLQQCADLKEAQALLKTLPPTAASGLRAQLRGGIITLIWNPSATNNVQYAIIRKGRSQPASGTDGTELARVSGTTYEDTQPIIGLPLYYAVYAICEGVFSLQAALLTKPMMLVQDVTQEGAMVSNQRVDLSWRLPPYAHSVVMVRKEQSAPTSMHDGVQIPVASTPPTSIIDRSVQNGQLYYYGIYCQFEDFEGRLVSAPGKIVSAKPETPPTAITSLLITSTALPQGYEVSLRWQLPTKGVGVVLKSGKPSGLKVGDVVPEAQLRSLGQVLEDRPDGVNDTWTAYGVAYYTPVVLFQRTAYIGAEQRFAAVEDVRNVTRQISGNILHLMWTWPPSCQEVVIHVKVLDLSLPDNTTVGNASFSAQGGNTPPPVRLSRAEYGRVGGYYEIQGVFNHTYYVTIAALIPQGNDLVQAQGQTIRVTLIPMMEISYYIKNPTFVSRKRTLHIHPVISGLLPPFRLVCKSGVLPFHKGDGEIIGYWGAQQLTPGRELVLELPANQYPPTMLCKLFLEDDAHYDLVRVNLPREERLRLQ